MAKGKSADGVNKSEIIRQYKKENPSAKPKEIVEAMAAAGVTVTPQTVSTVLSNAKKKGGKIGKRGRKAGSATQKPTSTIPAGFASALDAVIAGAEFLRKAGSAENARAIINRLASGSEKATFIGNG